jgi:hypothetical protein
MAVMSVVCEAVSVSEETMQQLFKGTGIIKRWGSLSLQTFLDNSYCQSEHTE